VSFDIVSQIQHVRTIASGRSVRAQRRLRKQYGHGFWRKRKGIALVKFADGSSARAELHWYEATGIGKKEFKIKRLLG